MDTNFYQQLLEEEKVLVSEIQEKTETLKAVQVLKNRYENNGVKIKEQQPLTKRQAKKAAKEKPELKFGFPTAYDAGLNQFQKTYVALYQLGSGFATDIAKRLTHIAPKEFNMERAYKVAREKASDLYQYGIFDVEKYGRKYKYFIKEKSSEKKNQMEDSRLDSVATNGKTTFLIEAKQYKGKPGRKPSPGSFINIVMQILEQHQRPFTSKELVSELQNKTHKTYEPRNVSSQLITYSKKPETIKKQILPGRKFHEAGVWGLSTWFHGDRMDNRYLDKVKAPEN